MTKPQFSLSRLMWAVSMFAVAIFIFRRMSQGLDLAPWLTLAFLSCSLFGAGTGLFFGCPIRGAILGVLLIPPACVITYILLLTAGVVQLEL
jgi:hypothetical protein